MPRHMRMFVFAVAMAVTGATLGVAQAADPERIPDADPALMRTLSGDTTKVRDLRPLPATPGQDMKGVVPDSRSMLVRPSDADRRGGGALRVPEKAGGSVTPIGTLNIVRGEQLRDPMGSPIAERPGQRTDGQF